MRGIRFLPGFVCGGLFVAASVTYIVWFLTQQPSVSFAAAYNGEITVGRLVEIHPGTPAGQTFTWPGPGRLGGVVVKYIPRATSEAVLLRATLAAGGQPLQTLEGAVTTFAQPQPWIFEEAGGDVAALAPLPWLFFLFAPTDTAGPYTLTLETVGGSSLAVPFEIASQSYPAGQRVIRGAPQAGDLSFLLLAAASPREHVGRLLGTEPHLVRVLLLLAASLVVGLAVQLVQRARRGSPLLPDVPLLLWLLLAILFTLPLFYTTRAWGTEDWPEVAAHFAAARHNLTAGQFPLWNPYFCGGFPAWGNPQTYWASPTFLLAGLAGDVAGTKLAVSLAVFLGMWGMSLLGRTAGLRYPALLVPPIIFMASGFFAFHISAGHVLWTTMAWVPWVVHFFWRGVREGRMFLLAAAALFYVLILVEGQLYFFIYTGLLLAGLSAALWLSSERERRRQVAGLFLLFVGLSAGFGAVKLLPTWAFVQQTEGVLADTPAVSVRQLPDLFLGTPPDSDLPDGQAAWWERLAYIGMWPILAALLGVAGGAAAGRGVRLFFLTAGLLALGLVIIPGEYNPLEQLPLLRQLRSHSRALVVVILSVSLLAGFGLAALRRWLPARGYEAAVLASTLLLFADFSQVAHQPLAAAFREPVLHSDAPPSFAMRASRKDGAYHMALSGTGAPQYCPPHLRSWGKNTEILIETDAGYRGEVYSERGTRVSLQSFSPNRLLIAVGAVGPAGDWVVINQKYDHGWRMAEHTVASREGRLAFPVSPADSGRVVKLHYLPTSFIVGASISGMTAALLAVLGVRSLRRRRDGASR